MVITGAGTSSSMAASIASDPRLNSFYPAFEMSSFGSFSQALTARSSNRTYHAAVLPDLTHLRKIERILGFLQHLEAFGVGLIIPYSMPLWTILTKWPAPFGPTWP